MIARNRCLHFRTVWLIAVMAALPTLCALAQTPAATQTLSEMFHSSKTIRQGAPGDINSLAQTTDGFLWLGTDDGLFRFDGETFERFRLNSSSESRRETIVTLTADRQGGLWISHASGGATFLKGSTRLTFGPHEGLATGAIHAFAFDRQGSVWAASSTGLKVLHGSQWHLAGADWDYPAPRAVNAFVDRRGTLWVGTGSQILYLPDGARKFRTASDLRDSIYAFAEAPNGALWVSLYDSSVISELALPDGSLARTPKALHYKSEGPTFSRDGSFWIPTDHDGVYRLHNAGTSSFDVHLSQSVKAEHYGMSDGLTSDYAVSALQDREGSIWISSLRGIDQFRLSALTNLALPANFSRVAIASDGADGVIVASKITLHVDQNGSGRKLGGPERVTSAYRDPSGTIWLGGEDGLWQSTAGGPFKAVPLPADMDPAFHVIQTITMDRNGALWVSILHSGFLALSHGTWSHPPHLTASAHDAGLTAFADSAGKVWLGLRSSRVQIVDGETVTDLGKGADLDVGDITAIYERNGRIWIGGEGGLEFFDHSRLHHLLLAGGAPLEGVSGILQTANGDLWVNQASGVLHVPSAEIDGALADPSYRCTYRLYNYLDGLLDSAHQIRPNPTILQTPDGKIYFATRSGVAWLDPAHLLVNSIAPSVVIDSVLANGRQVHGDGRFEFPPDSKSLEVRYTATSLLIPERVRFKYKLERFDTTWNDVGTRRQAFYSNLPPGKYRFQVMASNNDGLWNEAGASFGFVVPPTFLQSIWFKALCVLCATTVLTLLYRVRLSLATRKIRDRLYQRLSERERIARDLHDTFFQGVQGLLLRVNTGTAQLPLNEPARTIFEEVLTQSDKVMLQGRELVLDLRTGAGDTGSLAEAFVEVCVELQKVNEINFKTHVHGAPKDLHPIVFEEAYRLGREALVNAFRHSRGSLIEAELNFEPSGLRLRFRDDGIGIDAKVMSEGRRQLHWGLPGMRERAKKIGAHMDLWSRKGAGTEVEVHIPSSVAYRTTEDILPVFDRMFSKKRESL